MVFYRHLGYLSLVALHSVYTILKGAVAQLGERLNGIQEVVGSIPISSTIEYCCIDTSLLTAI